MVYLDWPEQNFLEKLNANGFEALERIVVEQNVKVKALSYHPRMLNEKECLSTKMFYAQFVGSPEIKLYNAFELRLLAAFEDVFRMTKKFYIFKTGKLALIKRKKTLYCHLVKSLRTEESTMFILPKKHTIIVSGFDLTWQIYSWLPPAQNKVIDVFRKNRLNIW